MAFILISGKARHGKDTLGSILKDELNKGKDKYVTVAVANILKEKLKIDFGLTNAQLHGDLKEVPDVRYPKTIEQFQSGAQYWTPREFMQYYGDFFRSIKPTYWVDNLIDYCRLNNIRNAIITDVRFPNEINQFKKEFNGIHVRIQRDIDSNIITNSQHCSEVALDNYGDVDYIIKNNGTIDDLINEAKKLKEEILKHGR